jgi:hypothetical protein
MVEVYEHETVMGISVPSSHSMPSSALACADAGQLLAPVVHTDGIIVGDPEVDKQPIMQVHIHTPIAYVF